MFSGILNAPKTEEFKLFIKQLKNNQAGSAIATLEENSVDVLSSPSDWKAVPAKNLRSLIKTLSVGVNTDKNLISKLYCILVFNAKSKEDAAAEVKSACKFFGYPDSLKERDAFTVKLGENMEGRNTDDVVNMLNVSFTHSVFLGRDRDPRVRALFVNLLFSLMPVLMNGYKSSSSQTIRDDLLGITEKNQLRELVISAVDVTDLYELVSCLEFLKAQPCVAVRLPTKLKSGALTGSATSRFIGELINIAGKRIAQLEQLEQKEVQGEKVVAERESEETKQETSGTAVDGFFGGFGSVADKNDQKMRIEEILRKNTDLEGCKLNQLQDFKAKRLVV